MLRRVLIPALIALSASTFAEEPITLRMMAGPSFGIPPKEATDPRSQARRAIFETFQRLNPDIRVVNAGGLELTGERADSGFLMAMAGDTAPDVFYVNFRQYYNYIDQGFCRPLDDFITKDPSALERVNPLIQKVVKSYDGKVYAIPWFQVAQALYYRKDFFAQAGLDPDRPPRTWDEFYEYGKRIVESSAGRSGFIFSAGIGGKGYHWSNFVWQAGGEIVVPTETKLWKSAIATPEAARALDFFRRLTVEKWKGADGKNYGPVASISATFSQDIADGKAAMWFAYTNDVVLNMSDLNPSLLGVAAMPEGPAGRANEINAGMWAINATITDQKKLEACWRFIKFFASNEAARVNTERFVELGLGRLVNPQWLQMFGYEDLVSQVDPNYVEANKELFKTGHPEPYGRNCQQVYTILDGALDRARLEPSTPAMEILQAASKEMDQKLLGYTPPDVLAKQRATARFVFGTLIFGAAIFFGVRLYKWLAVKGRTAGLSDGALAPSRPGFVALCLMPAIASVAVWSYYPLVRGLVIAFQDYKIVGRSEWVGFDNFISVFTQPIFWKSLVNSFIYVALTILIGFVLPIAIAIALNEIPRFKVLFRTLFYLPAMTSGIVIAVMWRQFYDKSETGLLNTLVRPFVEALNNLVLVPAHQTPWPTSYDWLGDPKLAMLAVVIPGVWAGAGPGSILYLAALKNIPEERYEAADLDGANWRQKISKIMLPGLKPLILINLLGVFIGSFKAMESVFVLTGGGPLYSTHTIGLEVWSNAFMFLKFGYATAAAWVMGSILVGFTLIQIRSVLKMRFVAARPSA